jgi:hypothetical protein
VIVDVMTVLPLLKPKVEAREDRLHRDGSFLFGRFGTGFDDFQQVKVMLEAVKRCAFFQERVHHLGQAVRPKPGWIERLKLFPASRAVSP